MVKSGCIVIKKVFKSFDVEDVMLLLLLLLLWLQSCLVGHTVHSIMTMWNAVRGLRGYLSGICHQ